MPLTGRPVENILEEGEDHLKLKAMLDFFTRDGVGIFQIFLIPDLYVRV